MSAFLIMNATDAMLVANSADHYTVSFSDPVSQYFQFLFNGMENSTLIKSNESAKVGFNDEGNVRDS